MQVIAGHSEGKQGVAGHSVQQQSISCAPAAISLPREVRLAVVSYIGISAKNELKGSCQKTRRGAGGLPTYPKLVD